MYPYYPMPIFTCIDKALPSGIDATGHRSHVGEFANAHRSHPILTDFDGRLLGLWKAFLGTVAYVVLYGAAVESSIAVFL